MLMEEIDILKKKLEAAERGKSRVRKEGTRTLEKR